MFLKYSSCTKHKLDPPYQSTLSNLKQTQLPTQDQYAFTDFFIRKTNQTQQNPLKYNQSKQKTKQSTTKNNNFLKSNEDLPKPIHDNVFCLPQKKTFDIKYMTQKLKTKNASPFQSLNKKQNSQRFKSKKQHLIERKLQPFLSLKGSARCTKQRYIIDQEKFQLMPHQLADKSRSFQFSVNFADRNISTNEKNKQKRQGSLLSAYKIKSLILERNPKQQILEKTRKYLRKQIDKKLFTNISHLQSARTQSQQPYDSFSRVQMEQSRLTTQQQASKKSHRANMALTTREKHNIRFSSPRQNVKINLKTNGKKNISILDEKFSSNKQVTLQPWIKSNYEQDIFSENIQLIEIEFQPFEKTLENSQNLLSSINSGHRTTRNSYRKIYSTKENSKFIQATIRSEK